VRRRRLPALVAVLAACLAAAPAASAHHPKPKRPPLTVAVIGDTPYGEPQVAAFPRFVDALNAAPGVRLIFHLGDIKTGSSVCSDAYFAFIRAQFDRLWDPLVYTPGDNEWTDCHRPAAGGYDPLERLDAVREVFFSRPDRTLGGRMRVDSQAELPENVAFSERRVGFATVHVVGSNNGLAPWFGGAETPAQTAARLAEYEARLAADLAWIDHVFDRAERRHQAGVVLAMQADMWDGADQSGFAALKARIEARAAAFGRPVLLLQGDSHRYKVDNPLPGAPNLTRVVVEGETVAEWLRLSIDPRAAGVFSWERVPIAALAPAAP
jgi:hypothetical protein